MLEQTPNSATGWEVGQLTTPDAPDGWNYVVAASCYPANSPKWPDKTTCDDESTEARFYHDDVRVMWPDGTDHAYDETRFNLISRVIPARTRALGRIDFAEDIMPVTEGESQRPMRILLPGESKSELMSTVSLSEGATTSNFDHSLQYHGYLTEVRKGVSIRSEYYRSILLKSLGYRQEDYSALGPTGN